MKKRILQLVGSFHQGGSERQAVSLTRMQREQSELDVSIATLNNDGALKAEVDALGLSEIPEFPLTSFYNANFVRQVRRAAAYLRDERIDLIHTHDFYSNIFGMAAASLAGLSARVVSKRETGGMRSSAQEFVEKMAFDRAKAIVVNAEAVRQHLLNRTVSADKLELIYNGLDLARFENVEQDAVALRSRLGLPVDDNAFLVTLVANLRHGVKNVPMLLRAAKIVTQQHRDAHFIIAGEGELETELKAIASELGVSANVHFIGSCSDVPALLAASDVCTLTSTAEGFSNSILEYMAAGKPVVATDVGGASEAIVEGETGYLVASDDAVNLSEKVNRLLDDSALAIKMGAAGKRRVGEMFSTATQLAKTTELYNTLLDQN